MSGRPGDPGGGSDGGGPGGGSPSGDAGSADWILTGARIWTGVQTRPDADALALRAGRIMAVGRARDLEGLRGKRTAVLDLEGSFVMPGFVDAHVHLQEGGLQLFRVDLRGADSTLAFIRSIADRARVTPGQGWILGGDWDHQLWGGEMPRRAWLDRAAPGRPVFVRRTDMHMGVASTRALEWAGIDARTPDPEGGLIDRSPETGEPTGVLRERAMELVTRVIPPPTPQDRRAAIRAAMLHALERGVTQVHDMGALQDAPESWDSLHTLRALRAEGRLQLRVSAAVPVSEWAELLRFIGEVGAGDSRLRWGSVKGFVDGSLGASTAWFHEPYVDQGGNRGTPVSDLDELAHDLRGAARAGLQPIAHAIGDRANDWLLDLYESLAEPQPVGAASWPERAGRVTGAAAPSTLPGPIGPAPELRPRIEHAQHLTPEGIRRAARSNAAISVQPLHLVDDGRWAPEALGPEREGRSFAFRSLLEGGGALALGSDWTVAPIDPIGAIQAAVTRRVWEPSEGEWGRVWLPDERLTLVQALRAHTLGGAHAAYMESETGTLEPGKRADLAVLTADPFEVEPEDLREAVQVEMTFVDGVLAYRAGDLEAGMGS